jgi:hypothetical protein
MQQQILDITHFTNQKSGKLREIFQKCYLYKSGELFLNFVNVVTQLNYTFNKTTKKCKSINPPYIQKIYESLYFLTSKLRKINSCRLDKKEIILIDYFVNNFKCILDYIKKKYSVCKPKKIKKKRKLYSPIKSCKPCNIPEDTCTLVSVSTQSICPPKKEIAELSLIKHKFSLLNCLRIMLITVDRDITKKINELSYCVPDTLVRKCEVDHINRIIEIFVSNYQSISVLLGQDNTCSDVDFSTILNLELSNFDISGVNIIDGIRVEIEYDKQNISITNIPYAKKYNEVIALLKTDILRISELLCLLQKKQTALKVFVE